MAERAEDIQAWLSALPEGTLVGINDEGMALTVLGDEDHYYEIGGLPQEHPMRVTLQLEVTARTPEQAIRHFLDDAADPQCVANEMEFRVEWDGQSQLFSGADVPRQVQPTAAQSPAELTSRVGLDPETAE